VTTDRKTRSKRKNIRGIASPNKIKERIIKEVRTATFLVFGGIFLQ
jgi:hypothetical protein